VIFSIYDDRKDKHFEISDKNDCLKNGTLENNRKT